MSDPRVKDITYITAMNLANPENPAVAAELAPPRALQLMGIRTASTKFRRRSRAVEFADQASGESMLKEWDEANAIWYAEPNYVSHLAQAPRPIRSHRRSWPTIPPSLIRPTAGGIRK